DMQDGRGQSVLGTSLLLNRRQQTRRTFLTQPDSNNYLNEPILISQFIIMYALKQLKFLSCLQTSPQTSFGPSLQTGPQTWSGFLNTAANCFRTIKSKSISFENLAVKSSEVST
ncbi:hypothetical protein ACHWQZ_G004767, partial [Mnemiopsis leidyi]